MSTLSTRTPIAPEEGRPEHGIDRRCRQCGYGIATRRLPVHCPMCYGKSWQPIKRYYLDWRA